MNMRISLFLAASCVLVPFLAGLLKVAALRVAARTERASPHDGGVSV